MSGADNSHLGYWTSGHWGVREVETDCLELTTPLGQNIWTLGRERDRGEGKRDRGERKRDIEVRKERETDKGETKRGEVKLGGETKREIEVTERRDRG